MNMKRPRNAECGKLRRPLKRSKITDGIYGSTFLYLKFLVVWALVMILDFIVEFRFEYLWPFWLLLRSVYDSFKYQGLAFSVFFVCVAVTSDVICYLFIPVQWLFFAASTYVWVQYVWHTERGICLPTVSLWLLFVYIEASVRLRDFKSLPFHLDLCRPFAAHCIGYPVVTLGFGFKSYVSYRIRVRKQKDVERENDFYVHLLQQALPEQQNTEKPKVLPSKTQEEIISNGLASNKKVNKSDIDKEKDLKKPNNTEIEDFEYIEHSVVIKHHNVNDYEEENYINDQHAKTYKTNGFSKAATKMNVNKDNVTMSKKGKSVYVKENPATTTFTNNKDDLITRLETDVKRLKTDLQSSRNCEQELRSQINNLVICDKSMKSELYQLRQDNESLQSKLHNLVTSRQQDKQNLSILEKKLQDERKSRAILEQQLTIEKKGKKAEELAASRAVMSSTVRGDCTDICKVRRKEFENDIKQLRRELKLREDQIRQIERETQLTSASQNLRQYQEAQNETEVLMSALAAMQDKTTHLENSLSAETRLKLDLFSALGKANRQIQIQQGVLSNKEQAIDDLKSKVAEVMALMPSTTCNSYSSSSSQSSPSPHFSASFSNPPQEEDVLAKSSLNPNASDYTPKGN